MEMNLDYHKFISKKKIIYKSHGIEIDKKEINSILFPFQRDIVVWALRKGRCAIFADTGLGKTFMQLEWAKHIVKNTGEKVLIVAPLAVSYQTQKEGMKLGIDTRICKSQEAVLSGITITNYERIENFDASQFAGVVLDESSILKSYSGVTKKMLLEKFHGMRFKLACTATPSPNDHMEILNHAEFLEAMKSHEALAIWFINDTMNFGTYRLKKHSIKDFWKWVSSWACSVSKPSDLGYDDNGFILPPLNFIEKIVKVDLTKNAGDLLFRIPELSATSFHAEKRESSQARCEMSKEIAETMTDQVMIWTDTNYDADVLRKILPDAVEIRGNDSIEKKERAAFDFAEGKIQTMISKPSIFGFGMNFQSCHNIIYCGLNFSYESFYQSVRRFWRFGQKHPVNVYLVMGETEKNIMNILKKKEASFQEMKENMNAHMKEFQEINNPAEYREDYVSNVVQEDGFKMILGDSVEEIKKIDYNSVGFTIFSPPFSNLYIYSDSLRDMGNNKNDDEFFEHFRFIIPDLLRITIPGRLCSIHCKDLVNYKGRDGASGIRDFPGTIIREMEAAGWQYHSRVTIWKDPVLEMQKTKSHGLLYKQLRKDASYSRQGLPDYILTFRKWSDEGDPAPINWKTKENFELEKWQRYASPVWADIQQTNVLNCRLAREDNDEKHICPLQLDVIERCLELWTNPGDIVFSPFAGIGSEGYVALKMGRRFVGIELKEEYFKNAIDNLRMASPQQELFGGKNVQ